MGYHPSADVNEVLGRFHDFLLSVSLEEWKNQALSAPAREALESVALPSDDPRGTLFCLSVLGRLAHSCSAEDFITTLSQSTLPSFLSAEEKNELKHSPKCSLRLGDRNVTVVLSADGIATWWENGGAR